MIRDKQHQIRVRPSSVLLLALFFAVAATPVVTRAGDQDGLGGYSMQLKRKYFDAGNTGSGGSGQIVSPDPKLGAGAYAPQTVAVEPLHPLWLISVQRYYAIFASWLR